MNLSTFVFVLLVFCIPYLGYVRNSIVPRRGFSILFLVIIWTSVLINFDIVVIISLFLITISIFFKNKNIEIFLFLISFVLLNSFLLNCFGTGFSTYLL